MEVRPAELVDAPEHLLDAGGELVPEAHVIDRAAPATLGARAVVGDEHEDRVVEVADLGEEVDDAPDLRVGVGEVRREALHEPRSEPLLVDRQVVPSRDPLGAG